MIRIVLPAHLRTLAQVTGEVTIEVARPVTLRAVLDELLLRGRVGVPQLFIALARFPDGLVRHFAREGGRRRFPRAV